MELSRSEFSYENGIFDDDIDYMIELIKKEIISLYKIRTNMKMFAFAEVKNCKLLPSKFNSLIDEVSRMSVEISVLEQKKQEYIKIKEYL
jgi:hypothetical protein